MNKFRKIFTGKESEHKANHGNNGHAHHHEHNGNAQTAIYQCPMKCEGDKTYDAPGNCPVCNMHLAMLNTESHNH